MSKIYASQVKLVRVQEPDTLIHATITSSEDAIGVFRDHCFDPDTVALREEMWMLVLSRRNRLMSWYHLSTGSDTGTVACVKQIALNALLVMGCGVILAHNHPSGYCQPSQADINMTRKIKEGLRLLDIDLLDHLILSPSAIAETSSGEYYSFANEGRL